jgi:hypothetical protein
MSVIVTRAGEVAVDIPTDLIQLYGFIATDGNVSHLRPPHSTTGYQVTAGKSLYIARMKVTGTGASGWWKFGYADNDVGLNTATARTNGVMALGLDDTGNNGILLLEANLATVTNPAPQDNFFWKLSIAAKYPFLRRVGAAPNQSIMIWAFEL